MQCLTPLFNKSTSLYMPSNSCKCENCKLTKRNSWAFRVYQQGKLSWRYSSFITLTYKDDDLLIFDSPHYRKVYGYKNPLQYAVLVPGHLRTFTETFNRYCKKLSNCKSTYYAIGEYGLLEKRPHYHLVFFSPLSERVTQDVVRKSWDVVSKDSIIDFQPITFADITYCTKHNLKECGGNKFQNEFSPIFQRCSKGIGIDFLYNNLQSLSQSCNNGVILNNYRVTMPYYYTKKLNAYRTIVNEFAPYIIDIINNFDLWKILLNFPELQKHSKSYLQSLVNNQIVKENALVSYYRKITNNKSFEYKDFLKIQRRIAREKQLQFFNKQRSKLIIKHIRYASKRKYSDYKEKSSLHF